jgi:chromosome transmission fidelity protein 4
MLAFTSIDGQFMRWTGPVPKNLTSPTATEQQEKRRVDRLLDDDERGGDVDMEERGEDIGDEDEDEGDWIVDDDGDYGVDEPKWGKGRTEVGTSISEWRCAGAS